MVLAALSPSSLLHGAAFVDPGARTTQRITIQRAWMACSDGDQRSIAAQHSLDGTLIPVVFLSLFPEPVRTTMTAVSDVEGVTSMATRKDTRLEDQERVGTSRKRPLQADL